MKRNRNISLFDKSLLRQSLHASFVKLDPRKMIKSPIMFTVEVVTFVMLLLLVYIAVTGDRSQGSFAYNFVAAYTNVASGATKAAPVPIIMTGISNSAIFFLAASNFSISK